jgi:hypothetical protein
MEAVKEEEADESCEHFWQASHDAGLTVQGKKLIHAIPEKKTQCWMDGWMDGLKDPADLYMHLKCICRAPYGLTLNGQKQQPTAIHQSQQLNLPECYSLCRSRAVCVLRPIFAGWSIRKAKALMSGYHDRQLGDDDDDDVEQVDGWMREYWMEYWRTD